MGALWPKSHTKKKKKDEGENMAFFVGVGGGGQKDKRNKLHCNRLLNFIIPSLSNYETKWTSYGYDIVENSLNTPLKITIGLIVVIHPSTMGSFIMFILNYKF